MFDFRAAFNSSNREKIAYIPCIVPNKDRPDYLATVDIDPDSQTYSQVGALAIGIESLVL